MDSSNFTTPVRESGVRNPLQMGSSVPRPESPMSEAPDIEHVGAQGINRRVDVANTLLGRPPRGPDKRKYDYDAYSGIANPLAFVATRDDRLTASEAGGKLRRIHEFMGVKGAEASILTAFDRGLFFCHTINGGSVLNPGRAHWSVPGYTEAFEYAKVRDFLGVDLRRFFRAFADDIAATNKLILDNFDPNDVVSVEMRGWLMEVAIERRLGRYPYLAHDSADACTELNFTERQAVMASKKMVIGSTYNSADRMHDTSRTQSADNFDSTAGERVLG